MKTLTNTEVQQIAAGSISGYLDFTIHNITLSQLPTLYNAMKAVNDGTMNTAEFNNALWAIGIDGNQYNIDATCSLSYYDY